MSLTAFLVLIRTITTVIWAVTHPVAGNAAVVPTFKLGGCTKFVCKGKQRELSILEKYVIYPNRKSCFSMCNRKPKEKQSGFSGMLCVFKKHVGIRGQLCRRLTTVCLISSVFTVILLITGPAHRNAATAGTSKEVDWTFKLPFICRQQKKTSFKIFDELRKAESIQRVNKPRNLGSFSHQKSLHSRCCRHTPMRTDNREWFSHSSGKTLLSLPGGRNGSNLWALRKMEEAFKIHL